MKKTFCLLFVFSVFMYSDSSAQDARAMCDKRPESDVKEERPCVSIRYLFEDPADCPSGTCPQNLWELVNRCDVTQDAILNFEGIRKVYTVDPIEASRRRVLFINSTGFKIDDEARTNPFQQWIVQDKYSPLHQITRNLQDKTVTITNRHKHYAYYISGRVVFNNQPPSLKKERCTFGSVVPPGGAVTHESADGEVEVFSIRPADYYLNN